MKSKIVLLTLSVIIASPAFASGGIFCEANDSQVHFEIGGVLSHGIPSGPGQIHGKLKFKDKARAELNLVKIENIAMFWLDEKELRLLVYNEDFPGNYKNVQLKITGEADESSENFYGTYVATTSIDGLSAISGKIICFVE